MEIIGNWFGAVSRTIALLFLVILILTLLVLGWLRLRDGPAPEIDPGRNPAPRQVQCDNKE